MKTSYILLAVSVLLSACGGGYNYTEETERVECAPNAFRNTENNCYVDIPAADVPTEYRKQ